MKIVVLGGGFAGVRAALECSRRLQYKAHVVLIDRNSYHLFAPALYEVAAAYGVKKDPYATYLRKTITIPFKEIFEDQEVEFIQSDISQISLREKVITTGGGEEIPFDHLVIGLGSQASSFGIPGVTEYAYQFKTLEDGLMIQSKLEVMFDEIEKGNRHIPLKIFVIGGGFTGIELAAELSTMIRNFSSKMKFDRKSYQITLFEAGPKIAPMVSDQEREVIIQRLTSLGIIVMENSKIEEVGDQHVKLSDGRVLHSDMVIWTAGVRPSSLLEEIEGLPLNQKGKILTDQYLRVKGFPEIFAAGDCAECIDALNQKPAPARAFEAINQAKCVAKNIQAHLEGKSLVPYSMKSERWVMTVGGKYALAHVGTASFFKGGLAWLLREAIDLRYLLSILATPKALSLFRSELVVFTKND